jgi:uncharacterized membrane protein YhiD involved in acid resistance
MHDSLEQLLGFGTVFGGLLGLIPFSIARHQGRKQYAVVALAACIISGSTIGSKLALPVFTTLTVMALSTTKTSDL